MKRFFLSSLRARLMFLVLLAVVPALGLMLYNAREQRQLAAMEAERNLRELVQIASDDYQRLIEGTRQLLIVLARLPAVRQHDTAGCVAIMADLVKSYQQYVGLGAYKPNGDHFCGTVPPKRPLNLADRPYFQQVLRTRDFTVGSYQIGRITGRAVLPFAYPVLDASGNVQAVTLAVVGLNWLEQLAAKVHLPQGSILTLVDSRSVILGQYPGGEKSGGKTVNDPILLQAIKDRSEGLAAGSGADGVPRFIGFTSLKGGSEDPMVLAISIPQKTLFSEADRTLGRNLFWLGVVSLIALAAAWFGSDRFILRPLNSLLNASKRLGSGDLSARAGLSRGSGELARLAETFDEMAGALQSRETEARQTERALGELSGRLLRVQDEERQRIARELHDNTSPLLASLITKLYSARHRAGDLDASTARVLDESLKLAEDTSGVIRTVSYHLHPPVLEERGLLASLRWYLNGFRNRTGVRVEMDLPEELGRLPRDAEIALFRIVQECSTNIFRHSGSRLAKVRLTSDQEWLRLEVGDEGRGLPPDLLEQIKKGVGEAGVGIVGMRERMRQLGGRLEIDSSPRGTTVAAILPVSSARPKE